LFFDLGICSISESIFYKMGFLLSRIIYNQNPKTAIIAPNRIK